MKLDYKAIGKRIKIQRIRKDMTQDKLAEITGLSNPHISNVESGSTQVSLKTLVVIADALDTTPDALLCDNIKNAKEAFTNHIITETEDCNELEIRIIADTVKTLKESIRSRMASFLKPEE
ncbi:MAG: anaerobic benzoate catabolism transcriptional regulator [Pelotomaculum sp. PtaU1.Bin065]|nr:MAG: anaerobic benzoate catabolism transcriptional regulator [Pelotomaculum sp. PtaU1.Bin065]